MADLIHKKILTATAAEHAQREQILQSLWSGYGEIVRYSLSGGDACADSVVVKWVSPPTKAHHPRGWNTDRSHQRKLRSYDVEMHWYQHFAQQCGDYCRVPVVYGVYQFPVDTHVHTVMVLEDLDAAGYHLRKDELDLPGVKQCLRWLANFHATFMGRKPEGLWPVGSYWHLDTRPDEFEAMPPGKLKDAAEVLDRRLSQSRFQTLVHGDAKVANFCFSEESTVAAVDFQYVGGGCGMKDVAYFLGSCMGEEDNERYDKECLDFYFTMLQQALIREQSTLDFAALEQEWRALYAVAWTDFYRFLQGWMPGHPKINAYTLKLAETVL